MPLRAKRFVLAGYFITLSFVLTGCTVPVLGIQLQFPSWVPFIGGGSLSPITLEYWGLWEPNTIMQPLFENYKQNVREHVTVAYQMRDPRQHFETIRARLSTNDTPDIVRVHATWVPYLTDLLEPLPSSIMSVSEYSNTFYPVVSKDLVINNNVYGMPLGLDGLALVYNADMLARAGYDAPPANWDDFEAFVGPLNIRNAQRQLIQGAVAMGYAQNVDHFSDLLGVMLAQNGVIFSDADGKVAFNTMLSADGNSNLGADALDFYVKFARTVNSYDPAWEGGSTRAFLEGKVAMIFVPSFRLIDILNANPQFTVKVAPMPQLGGRDVDVNWATYWVEVVPKNGSNPEESWKLLKHLTEQETLAEFYRTASAVRGFGEPYPRPDMANALSGDPRIGVYVSQFPTAISWPFADATHDEILNDAIIEALRSAVSAGQQGRSREGLNAAASTTTRILTDLDT